MSPIRVACLLGTAEVQRVRALLDLEATEASA